MDCRSERAARACAEKEASCESHHRAEIHNIGTADGNAIREVARKSNGIVEGFGGGIEWLEFFITGDKVYCVYLARDEAIIRKHAEKGGLPANRIVEVKRMMDPTSVLA